MVKKLNVLLIYAGSVPFILCALCLILGLQTLPLLGSVQLIVGIYALVIASFVAGSHWGQCLNLSSEQRFYLLIMSNIIALVLWLCFLILPFMVLAIVLAIIFVILLLIDKKLYHVSSMKVSYFRTRCTVTAIVVICLVICAIFS